MAKARTRIGVYPGTFDPVTNGHLDIIRRATRLVDQLVIGVARNAGKGPLFGIDERVEMLREEMSHLETANGGQIEIRPFDNLLMHFAQSVGAVMIIRGLRAVSDFEYEFKLAHMNAHLASEIEVVCLMTSSRHSFISSSLIREVASLGGDLRGLVPNEVLSALHKRFATPII